MPKSRHPRRHGRQGDSREDAGKRGYDDQRGRRENRGRGASQRDGGARGRRGDDRRAQGRGESPAKKGPPGFSEILMGKARAAHPDLTDPLSSPEPLARLDYAKELELKNAALQEFWQAHGLPDKPNRIHPSPLPRYYRVTTKRRVLQERGRFRLDFHAERVAGAQRLGAASELEPASHQAVYAFLIDKLNQESYAPLAHSLNFLVIRGDYTRLAVFFNVHRLNAGIARKAKLLAEHLVGLRHAAAPGRPETRVLSAFILYDPGRSSYYLDDRAPEGPWKLKRLFGPDKLRLRVGERDYAFGPTAFSQVNGSILPDFLAKAEQLLKPKPYQRLLDLYCGFGFFTLHLGPSYAAALGVEASTASIDAAKEMVPREGTGTRPQFRQGILRARTLESLLPKPDGIPEAILLDPPRSGTEPGVIRALASRAPARILHVFCDMDVLPREVNAWRKCGYMVSKVVPLDMFPGTDNLEVLVLFIPDRYGILNRIDRKDDFTLD